MNTPEYPIYKNSIDYLNKNGFDIICSCPPRGTEFRYKKCLFPKLNRTDKGSRDEIDIIAYQKDTVFFIECKPQARDSRFNLNSSNENDEEKLHRILTSYSILDFTKIFRDNYNFTSPFNKIKIAISSTFLNEETIKKNISMIDFEEKKVLVSSLEDVEVYNSFFIDFKVTLVNKLH